MKRIINWFEIPVIDFVRAKKFYENVLTTQISEMPLPNGQYGLFSSDNPNEIGGGLVKMEGYQPSTQGSIIYFNCNEDLNFALNKVVENGGKIILPKTPIGKNGFMAHFTDSEGNRVAFHSLN